MKKATRRIAPRLYGGMSRDRLYSGLPPAVKKGLKLIAASKGISLSYMLEQDVMAKYGLHARYVQPATLSLVRKRA